MSICLACNVTNQSRVNFCAQCGKKLRIQDRYRAHAVLGQGAFGKTLLAVDEGSTELEMVAIQSWSYKLGGAHQVSISAFSMGKYQITQAQYEAVMGNNPSHFKGANLPVEQVSWKDATAFCQKLSQQTGKNYRLVRNQCQTALPLKKGGEEFNFLDPPHKGGSRKLQFFCNNPLRDWGGGLPS